MSDDRFFIDHGVIHDRATGRHVRTAGNVEGSAEDGIDECCALLNSLAETSKPAPATSGALMSTPPMSLAEIKAVQTLAHNDGWRRGAEACLKAIEKHCRLVVSGFEPPGPTARGAPVGPPSMYGWPPPPRKTGAFYVQHRTAQETAGSGYRPPDRPWEYDGPFATFDEAKARWDKIHPDWQEGGVVVKCEQCGQYAPVAP